MPSMSMVIGTQTPIQGRSTAARLKAPVRPSRPDQETEAFQAIPYWASAHLQQDAEAVRVTSPVLTPSS